MQPTEFIFYIHTSMKKTWMIACATIGMAALAGCNSKTAEKNTAGIDLSSMDTMALPGTDFYQYANGGWIKKHPLTAEHARFGTFDLLAEQNTEKVHSLIKEIAGKEQTKGTAEYKIGTLYNLAMDSVKLNADGYAPIKAQLEKISAIRQKEEVFPMIAELYKNGVGTYFSTWVYADAKNSSTNIFHLGQGGLNLGEREYYLDSDSATLNIREKYKQYVAKIFTLAGFDEATAQKKMADVLEVETTLARVAKNSVERRDPEGNYNKMTYDAFKAEYTGADWDAFLKAIGAAGVTELNVEQPASIKEVLKIVNTLPVEKNVAYLEYNLIDAAAGKLSDEFAQTSFDFYGRVLSGAEEMRPRWKRSVGAVNGMLGELMGEIYVKRYFPEEAKKRMLGLVDNLGKALAERIQAQEWMSDSTKTRALEKLNTFHVKIGYPDKWKDYSDLNIENDSYWANTCRASAWGVKDMMGRIGKPVDKDEWLMTPQTVNAYYNPATNEICFPAAILQYPFFDMEADDAFNYGAIGVVIGHEMTHGFDDQGSQFDKDGNLKNWWAEGDRERFDERTKVMIDFFNNIEVLPGLHANGALTVGENIADHGGIKLAYLAFKNATKDAPLKNELNFTPEQRFFLAYAALWASNIRDEEIRSLTKMDTHSLGRWRVNGALPHIDAWYEAFNITEGDPLYIAPEKRVRIW